MGSKDNDGERMRDIVERLELQAFVADKIQSGMKPLIMDCLEEITRLRAENEKLRHELITSSDAAKYYDYGYSCARDMQKDEITRLRAEHKMAFEAVGDVVKANDELRSQIESAEQAYVRLDASMNRLKAAFRVNMLRAFPHMSHDEIDAEIEATIRESGDE